ncbi:P-loop containing nucleoside triphosphate hydrolase [Rhypophila decipiens]|uniref:P-loop containing nucleoside triphosphate hydrolase n=1 Tax=Rhypophila decipiens TaxID=261697 RepID=A0AAN6Y6J0_9PEZI|nr:P-loop containing nucleoside triphosphate hydrolase [Rhypophila decipiens]
MDILDKLELPLTRTDQDPCQIVVMTCGIAGAGKSTLSRAIVARYPNYQRLSCDYLLHAKHGLYRIDYPVEKHEQYLDEATEQFDSILVDLLSKGEKDIVLDRSLYAREDRDYYKKLVEEKGGRWILVYFRPASKELIWQRIQNRRKEGIDADCALEISEELLDQYWDGFEIPSGEGEIVVDVT